MTRKLIVSLDSGLTITVRPPTVRQFYEQRPAIKKNSETYAFIAEVYSRNDEGIKFTAEQVLNEFTTDDFRFWFMNMKTTQTDHTLLSGKQRQQGIF